MSALTRDPQMLQKGRSRTFLWDFFSSFSSLHRKALTEPATTVVQSLSHGDVLPSVYGLIGSGEQNSSIGSLPFVGSSLVRAMRGECR